MLFDDLLSKDERRFLEYCHKQQIGASPYDTDKMLAEMNWSAQEAMLICKSLKNKGFIHDHITDFTFNCTFTLSEKGISYKNLKRQYIWKTFQKSILWPIVVGVLATLLTLLFTKK